MPTVPFFKLNWIYDQRQYAKALLVVSAFILIHTRDYSRILKTPCTQAGGQTDGESRATLLIQLCTTGTSFQKSDFESGSSALVKKWNILLPWWEVLSQCRPRPQDSPQILQHDSSQEFTERELRTGYYIKVEPNVQNRPILENTWFYNIIDSLRYLNTLSLWH